MHPSQLKIKPPPIQVSPIAIIGAAAVVGTIAASLCIDSAGLFITTAVSVATIFSVLGLCIGCGSNTTVMLCVATTGLFFARFHQLAQATPPAWVVVLEGEHVELSGTVYSHPKTQIRTSGLMSMIDNRNQITRFDAMVSPVQKTATKTTASPNHAKIHSKPTMIHVRLDGTTSVQKGNKVTILGRIRRSAHENNNHATVFVSSSNHVVLAKKVLR